MPDRIPIVSIVMPTYNSGNTIRRSLESVRLQTIKADLVEVIIADGGSTDETIEIAKSYNCNIIRNELVQPEYGKLVGLQAARGRYVVFLDSDEVLIDRDSIAKKVALLEGASGVRNVITAGLTNPVGYPPMNDYVNRFGEPFSFFMYGLDGGDYVASLRRRYQVTLDDESSLVVKFGAKDVLPICDGGGHCFDVDFLRQIVDISAAAVVPLIFSLMADRTQALGVIKGDFTEHYSTVSLLRLLKKIHWRIRSNVHRLTGIEGYVNREKREPWTFRMKKFIFIPYALSVVFPLVDALGMCIRRRHAWYLMHVPLSIFTAVAILWELGLKTLGFQPPLRAYGD